MRVAFIMEVNMVINSSLLGKAVKVIVPSEVGPKEQIMIFQGLVENHDGFALAAILEDEKGRLLYTSTGYITFIDTDDVERMINRYRLKPIPITEFINASLIGVDGIFDDSKNPVTIVDMKCFNEWDPDAQEEKTMYIAYDERNKAYKCGELYWYGRN